MSFAAFLDRARELVAQKRHGEAEAVYRSAIAAHPLIGEAHLGLAEALQAQGRSDEAIALFAAISERDPESPATLSLFDILTGECRWPEADRLLERMRTAIRGSPGTSMRPFRFLLGFDEPALHLELGRRFALRHGIPFALPRRDPIGGTQIRIAYLSCNLNQHPMARWISEIIELHDRSQFRVYAFDWSEEDGSAERVRLKSAFDSVIGIGNLSDAEAAQLLRSERIDIAVDLMGYTMASRPQILAARPCPVQVNYIGYPGTLGAPWIDYVIGDPWVTPFEHAAFFSEKIVQLPFSYQPNDRKKRVAEPRPTRADCGLPASAFVFCCTNHPHKITAAMFDVWLRILKKVPGSVLWLWVDHPTAQSNLRAIATNASVDPGRLVFAPPWPNAEHLARLSLADVFLDSFPYNAHTSASDALWVGVPVVSMPGQTFHARVAASVLAAAELPELICCDLAEYESKAVFLATHMHELNEIRKRVASARHRAPLFDTPRFLGHLEAAFRAMFDSECQGIAPSHMRIDPFVPPSSATAPLPLHVAELFNQRGIEMAQARRFVEAEALLRQAIALHPDFAKAYNNLGNVLDEKQRPKEAEDAYVKATAVDPGYALAHSNLSLLLKKAGRHAEADAALRRARSLDPSRAGKVDS